MPTGPIFGIGFQKTGQVTLAHHVTNNMRYRASSDFRDNEDRFLRWKDNLPDSVHSEYFEDDTLYLDSWSIRQEWTLLLDNIPNSRFIFTTRPLEEWIRSCLVQLAYNWHTGNTNWVHIDTKAYIEFYEKQHALVAEMSTVHPGRILTLELGHWHNSRLATFLETTWNARPAPLLNTSHAKLQRMVRDLRQ